MTKILSSSEMFDDNDENNESRLLFHWQQFDRLLPDEAASRRELYKMAAHANLLYCHDCGEDNLEKNSNMRVLKCLSCGKHTWYTAGTFFHHMKLVRPWLAAMWLMERGVVFSALRFCRLVGIALSSAIYILKKLTFVIKNNMQENTTKITSAAFVRVICKRSRQTPRDAHPVAEQELIDQEAITQETIDQENQSQQKVWPDQFVETDVLGAGDVLESGAVPGSVSMSMPGVKDVPGSVPMPMPGARDVLGSEIVGINIPDAKQIKPVGKLNEQEQKIYELLLERTMSYNELCANTGIPVSELAAALVIMELEEIVERLPGDRYALSQSSKSMETLNQLDIANLAKVESFINFIRINFHGISRKYLQNYLAFHWSHKVNLADTYGPLFEMCLRLHHITYIEILNYVSPPIVQMLA